MCPKNTESTRNKRANDLKNTLRLLANITFNNFLKNFNSINKKYDPK